jgi:hypothetical protein
VPPAKVSDDVLRQQLLLEKRGASKNHFCTSEKRWGDDGEGEGGPPMEKRGGRMPNLGKGVRHRIPPLEKRKGLHRWWRWRRTPTWGWGQTPMVGIKMGTKKDKQRRWERTSG